MKVVKEGWKEGDEGRRVRGGAIVAAGKRVRQGKIINPYK
jgi:hypothetical protein